MPSALLPSPPLTPLPPHPTSPQTLSTPHSHHSSNSYLSPPGNQSAARWRELNALIHEHEALSADEAALEREVDLLRHQVREIEAAQLRADEEEEMLARYAVASNSRRLLELSAQIAGRLTEADDAVLPRLTEIGKLLRDLERIDPATAHFGEAHVRAATELEELARGVQSYAEELELEPGELARLEERVSVFESLKRKYGGSIAAVIEFGQVAGERLQKIDSRGAELERLAREITAGRAALLEAGRQLGKKRHAAAPKLAASVTAQLRDLGFQKSAFTIELAAHENPAPGGLEAVEFLFAPNPGEPAKPLKAIASSGEISRVMLAVKSSLAAQDTIALLVFDEIDANVGGEIAHAVGAKMRTLGEAHQILCISHLPQVAALAREQFVVTKEFVKERTTSQLRKVEGEARIEEIARMLGGRSESALAHARTLLGQ
jgi:DNA repair protein RecN (Recombination protein N)